MNEITENTQVVTIEDEMRGAYLDYAMSVIVGRALPDVRDGLKPVHRRALYAMYDLGNAHNKPYKKSARVVGDVIGKYHPHGDVAVYDTIVRMAQDFSLRYPLVDGQGNFGSIDGDAPAAMRYTEIRMAKVTDDLLADIDRDTVDFGPNYDDSLQEPLVLPSRIPNLLVNGSAGIAVGMATSIPPHNLNEVIDAAVALIDKPSLDTEAMLQFVKGPDFPTGALMFGGPNIKEAYKSGRGAVTMRAKTEIETFKGDRERILVTELPYQVNKAKLIEKIAELVRDKKVEGISDLRDESDRTGMRIVIELRKGENSNVILNRLYKLTQLQENFGINLLAIHQGQPRTFNLRDMLWAFVEHRKDVVIRRARYDLKKAEARAHVLEGLKRAVENIDAVIALIKAAKGPDEARTQLMSKFSFSEIQAQAILEMRLQRLTGLEREKIIEEHKQVLTLIEELRRILGSESLVYELIKKELIEVKTAYGDKRRTEIVINASTDFEVEDLIADEETLVSITHTGYIKRTDPSQFRAQGRGGRGIRGVATGDEDFVTAIYRCTTLSFLLCFTDRGKMYWLKVYKVPEASRGAKGKAVVNLVALAPGEKIKAILPVREFKENEYVTMVTRAGVIKKTPLSDFSNVRNVGIHAISIDEGDELVGAKVTNGKSDVFLCSKDGMSIRFNEEDVRGMGRTARGVIGMALDSGDRVVAMEVLETGSDQPFEILTVTENGYGKRTPVVEYRQQSRGGKGIITMKTTDKNGAVLGARQVLPKDDLMLVSNRGQMIRINVGGISEQGRNTQGVRLMTVGAGEKVVSIEYMAEENGAKAQAMVRALPKGLQRQVTGRTQTVKPFTKILFRAQRIALVAVAGSFLLAAAGCTVDSTKRHYVLAEKLWTDGKYAAAVSEFEKVAARDPHGQLGTQALLRAATTQELFLSQYEPAIAKLKRFVESSTDGEAVWAARKEIGDLLFNKTQQYDQSILYYSDLLQIRPTAPEAPEFLYRMGRSQYFMAQFDDATKSFDRITHEYPQSPWAERAAFQLAQTKLAQGEQTGASRSAQDVYKSATALYSAFIKQYPKSRYLPEAQFGIASCYEEMDQLDAAYQLYQSLEKTYPDRNVILIKLARIRERKAQRSH